MAIEMYLLRMSICFCVLGVRYNGDGVRMLTHKVDTDHVVVQSSVSWKGTGRRQLTAMSRCSTDSMTVNVSPH